jgi:hypothetical protein
MITELELNVPTSYDDITLAKWLNLQKELENYSEDEEATTAIMLYHLCGLDPAYMKNIAMNDYNVLKAELTNFLSETQLPLQKTIWIDGVEYGFEPNLSDMAYGAYADITKYDTFTIDENWAKIMSILYRPITDRKGDMYSIKPYDGEIDGTKFLEVSMSAHFGALFFFVNLSMDLLKGILSYTMETDIPHNMRQILVRSGQLIQQSMSLRTGTSLNTKR